MVADVMPEGIVVDVPEEAVEERLHALAQAVRIVLGPAEIDGIVPVADIAEPPILDDAGAQVPAVVENIEWPRCIASVRAELEDAAAVMEVGAKLGIAVLPLLADAAPCAFAARLVVEPADIVIDIPVAAMEPVEREPGMGV